MQLSSLSSSFLNEKGVEATDYPPDEAFWFEFCTVPRVANVHHLLCQQQRPCLCSSSSLSQMKMEKAANLICKKVTQLMEKTANKLKEINNKNRENSMNRERKIFAVLMTRHVAARTDELGLQLLNFLGDVELF